MWMTSPLAAAPSGWSCDHMYSRILRGVASWHGGAGVGVPPSGISVGAEGGGSHAIGGRQVIFGADSDGLGPVLRSGVYTVSGARVSNSPSPLSHHDSGKRLLQLGRCLMADPQHIAWLKEGERSWNARRQIQQFDPDLSSEDISRALGGHEREDISEISVRLQDVNFSGAKFQQQHATGHGPHRRQVLYGESK